MMAPVAIQSPVGLEEHCTCCRTDPVDTAAVQAAAVQAVAAAVQAVQAATMAMALSRRAEPQAAGRER